MTAAEKEKKKIDILVNGQKAIASINEISAAAAVLSSQLKKLPANSKEFADKSKELGQVKDRLKGIKDEVNGVGGVFGKVKNEIKAFGIVAAGALGFEFITSSVKNLIAQNAKLADSFADIRKTTGMTEQEVLAFSKSLSSIDTRTSTKELRDIAIAAGQLGIAKNDILSFTDATDKIVVALGDEFKGGAEQVTKEMGALRNVFADIKSDNIAGDMLHIGNAVNELASAGAATGPVVADFASRIGGVGINLGLTSGQVLGLSATLQELNVSTERGGTAITKILLKMTTDTDKFAKVAGMSTKEFTELVNKDLFGAFKKVTEGSKKAGSSATEFGKILDELGVDGAGASEVFSKLGANSELLQTKVDLANTSLKGTDSIMNEFALKNDNLAGRIDKLGKTISAVFVSETFNNWVSKAVDGTQSLVNWLIRLPKTINENRAMLIAIGTALVAYNGALIQSKLLQISDLALKKLGIATSIVQDGVTTSLTGKQILNNIATSASNKLRAFGATINGVFTGTITLQTLATNAQTFAVNLLNKAWAASPFGLITAAVGLTIASIVRLNDELEKMKELIRDAYADEVVRRTNIQFGKTKGLMGDINKLTLEQIATREKDLASRIDLAKLHFMLAAQDKNIGAEQLAAIRDNFIKTLDFKRQLLKRKKELLDEEIVLTKKTEDTNLEASKEAIDKLKKLRDEALEEYKRLIAEYNDIEDKRFFDMLSKNDQELKAVNDKYDKLIEARKKFLNNPLATKAQKQVITTEINTLNTQQGEDNYKITQKQAQQTKAFILDLEAKQTRAMNTEYENRVLDIQTYYDKKRAEAIEQGNFEEVQFQIERAQYNEMMDAKADRAKVGEDKINEISRQHAIERRADWQKEYLAINDKYALEMEALRARYGEEYYLNEEFLEQKAALEKLAEEERSAFIIKQRKEVQEIIKGIELEVLNFALDLLKQRVQAFYDAEIAQVKMRESMLLEATEKERARLNGEVDTRTAADKRADAQKALIQKQAADREYKLKLKAFRADQAFSVSKALIDSALGVARAFAQFGPPPSPVGIAAGIAAGVSGGIQVASILAQKPPSMGKGGILSGDKHSDASGGMPIIDPSTGKIQALVEGGEAVIPASTVSANPDVIQQLLNASGKPIGLFNEPTFADTGNIMAMGEGGIFGGASSSQSNAEIVSAINKFSNAVTLLVSNPLYAELSFADVKKKFEDARKASKGIFPNRQADGMVSDGKVYLNDNIL